jgi:hypothetical protein
MPAPDNTRRLGDALLKTSGDLPNAANTVTTTSIDLGPQPYSATESLVALLQTTAGTGANAKNITITLQDSAEANANFAAVATLGATITTETGGSYPAVTARYKLPPGLKRYVRLSATGETNGGNGAGGTMTLSIRA